MGRRKTRQLNSVTVSRRQTPSNTESVCSGDNFGPTLGAKIVTDPALNEFSNEEKEGFFIFQLNNKNKTNSTKLEKST
jgi:hypothetical protein